jgi:hypothetical protein
VTKKIA